MNIWKALWRALLPLLHLYPPGPARDQVRKAMRAAAEKSVRNG